MEKFKPKYDFKEVENKRYDIWVEKGYFKAGKDQTKKPFTIVIPPPNVTGVLHLGHAWDNTLQDVIIRRKRMQGYDALYLPGSDHAGIATQARVEEQLRHECVSRYDLGREKFLEVSWDWTRRYQKRIREQWKALGISVDYSRERFTLDEGLNEAVNHVFITLYNEGLIYRDFRIINWDPQALTALSNIEVEHIDQTSKLYTLRYPLVDGTGYIEVATTRPETMFGDQAVMVHPNDKKYQKFHGKEVYIPGTEVKIPIILDSYVDMEFGTGAVKVTPAHDPNDFEVAGRHNLEKVLCMNEDATMNSFAFKYEGQDRFVCRENLLKDLDEAGLVAKIEDYNNAVGYSERTGVMVEPRLSLQWFLKMDDLAKEALKTETKFYPERFLKTYENWMNNIQDWCISRQLWWGHRIPAWYKDGEIKVQVNSPGTGWVQDEDVLDTWFSSALWPFSTLGWPHNTPDLKRYYPGDVLVTGYDIIFFWVARMIFQGRHFTKQDPFKDVLIHGLIRARDGQKMSKSLGNGVDPIDVIDQYGVDALRYFLTTNSAPGADLRYEEEKVESSWNFINKLWNIARFIYLNVDPNVESDDYKLLTLADKWVISRLNEVIIASDLNYDKYEFVEVARELYNFTWDEFASWYLEIAKVQLENDKLKENTKKILLHVLKALLKLMHPFIPFVTEDIFLKLSQEESIMISSWPVAGTVDQKAIEKFKIFEEMITKVRNLRSEYQVVPSKKININLISSNQEVLSLYQEFKDVTTKFLNPNNLVISSKLETKEETLLITSLETRIYVDKADIIDRDREIETLTKQLEELQSELDRSERMLSNENFISRAKPEKVQEEKRKYEEYLKQYKAVKEELKKYDN
ncbi:MAG TPA: valine--tRNA ligase [Acholeplasmataceae bacterium]|nr:valine--tRNA ligase [Acholeplasmataceae bacterium]